MTTDNGMSEVIALSLVDNLRESVQQDLEDDLKDEIYDQARRHKLKQVKDRRRSMGLPVEEFDDLSEDEEGRESLRRQLRNPAVRGPANEREEDLLGLVNDREDAGIYALTEDVNDLIMTHLFDSR